MTIIIYISFLISLYIEILEQQHFLHLAASTMNNTVGEIFPAPASMIPGITQMATTVSLNSSPLASGDSAPQPGSN